MQSLQHISVNFEDAKMVDNILKISRPGVFDTKRNCNYCVREKCRMDQRRYKTCQRISMFIGTHCSIHKCVIFNKHSEKQNIIMKKMLDNTY